MELLDILEQSIQSHQLNRAIMIEKGGTRHLNDEDELDELLNDMQSQGFDDADPPSQALKKRLRRNLLKLKRLVVN